MAGERLVGRPDDGRTGLLLRAAAWPYREFRDPSGRVVGWPSAGPADVAALAAPAAAAIASCALAATTFGLRWRAFGASVRWVDLTQACIALAALAWFVSYWILFTRRYLRLPSPGLVAAVVLGLAALLALVATTTILPNDTGMVIFQFLPGWE